MIEIGSPSCNTARNFLMSNVEIVHPEQPQDISSLRESENEFENPSHYKRQIKKKCLYICILLQEHTRTKQSFFSLIKIQQLVNKFKKNLRKNANLCTMYPKSPYVDYLLLSAYKGNYAAQQNSMVIRLKLKIKFIWEVLLYLINLLLILLLPFHFEASQDEIVKLNFCVFGLEMGIKFVQSFYSEGRLIRGRYEIIKHYLKTSFIVDFIRIAILLSTILEIPNRVEVEIIKDIILYSICLFKLHLKFICTNYYIVKFGELIFLVLFVCHFFTQQLFYWEETDYIYRFGMSLDIFLSNSLIQFRQEELYQLLNIFFEIVSLIVKIYILQQIMSYCLINQEIMKKKKDLFDLHGHLKYLNVSNLISNRVISYYKTIMKQDEKIKTQDFHLFFNEKLKPNLAKELKLQIQGNFLKNFKVFNKFTVQTKKNLICNMEEVDFSPNQKIYCKEEQDDQSIFFITQGKVMIMYGNSELQIYHENSSFGEISFFTGLPRGFTAISLGYSRLYKIQRLAYLNTVSSINQDLVNNLINLEETAQMIKDQIVFQEKFNIIGRKCMCCQDQNHLIQNCPFLHYKPNKDIILSKFIFPVKMRRNKYERRRLRYQNVLINQFFNHMRAQEYQENNDLINIEDQSENYLVDPQSSSFSGEFKMKNSSLSPDPIIAISMSHKKATLDSEEHFRKNKQAFIHPIPEYSDEIQSLASSDIQAPQFMDNKSEEPQIRIIQKQVKPKGDLLKSQGSQLSRSISQQIFQQRSRSQSQNVLDISQNQNNQINKKQILRSLSQLSYDDKTFHKQKSKRTSTSQQNVQSLIQLFQNDLNPILMDFIQIDLDRGCNFRTYLPQNNMKVVLRQNKYVTAQKRSKYTLNYEISKKLKKLTRL
ncbi:unnamed protein product (macronuclear) [Paramecium tetraurelia]|uniref:Cyclic nucleotide-binding domain-containing protein n=1 Tax=Paramecium tetraurelia TaxID=5888 RepID=A0BY58_PARTE|nr:uncharacterized protein GSPATT00033328001 [Paramecium tetraurelia]CAK63475.1 unnamed protein product [Paramecium tetraurelia]|eukprot:XP_001430873.1 hypothetical protein (macronuclear) [Paramecium tetraurelia strain d4-2]